MAIIDLTNPKTYPQCFYDVIDEWAQINRDIVKEIQNCSIKDDNSLQNAFYENFHNLNLIEHQLIDSLKEHRILAYHGTRVENLSSIKNNGLFLSKSMYLNLIKDFFLTHNISHDDLEELIGKLSEYYDYKYSDNPRQLCFVLNIKQFDSSLNEYDIFLKNIGGELARWTYKDDYPNIYKLLCTNGTPYIIKVSIPIKNISTDFLSNITRRFLSKVFAEKFISHPVEVAGEAKTKKCIPPEDILDIILV